MKILVSCHKSLFGFSLPELLVVLVILGLISSLVFQNFGNTLDTIKRWTQKKEVLVKIDRLGYVAREKSLYIDEDTFKDDAEMTDYFPENWKLQGDFKFFPNGSCSGGSVALFFKNDFVQQEALLPPLCKINASKKSL